MSLLAVVALALSSCGDGGDATGTPDQATAERLTPSQFAALENVYVQAVRYQERRGSAKRRTPAALNKVLDPLLRACGQLDGDDPLLHALRDACAGQARVLRYAARAPECLGPNGCISAFGSLRTALRSLIGSNRRADRAVRASGLTGACQSVLITPKATHVELRRGDAALTRIIRAIESQSVRDLRSAAAALRRIGGGEPSGERELRRFRSRCRPA